MEAEMLFLWPTIRWSNEREKTILSTYLFNSEKLKEFANIRSSINEVLVFFETLSLRSFKYTFAKTLCMKNAGTQFYLKWMVLTQANWKEIQIFDLTYI